MRSLVACAFVIVACGTKSEVPTIDASSDAPSSETASDTAVDTPPVCFDASGNLTSIPYKQCTNDSDCTWLIHQTDCCGNGVLVGVAKDQNAVVVACETESRSGFPGCGCPASAPKAEDGTTIEFGAMPAVHCTDRTSSGGICKTSKT